MSGPTDELARRSQPRAAQAGLETEMVDGRLTVRPTGSWTLHAIIPAHRAVLDTAQEAALKQVILDCAALHAWDSRFVVFVRELAQRCEHERIEFDRAALPRGVVRLLALADAAPERSDDSASSSKRWGEHGFLNEIGRQVVAFMRSAGELIEFTGAASVALARLLRGRARFRHRDLLRIMQDVGAEALPIVSLTSILLGVILAYIGSLQLAKFGAQEYVADLVAIAMSREMAAMMTGIILAGRTGAAFAAQLGTMTANEEIDALRTAAIAPMEFLVLPRIIALVLMLPLLTLYANLMGIIGGAIVGLSLLDIEPLQYLVQTRKSVDLIDFATGLIKACAYGVIVAVSGCLRGMQCGRSAAAVGEAATSAVVTGIVFIVVCSATLTVVYQVIGI
ncbi:MAG: phospholipid/cholesterol/gamma-HCH transport system permease protein [Gammaproteobacteria bacterium]|jgi:phospholipid/cholesterol/gamma-HCH transport system permease protein